MATVLLSLNGTSVGIAGGRPPCRRAATIYLGRGCCHEPGCGCFDPQRSLCCRHAPARRREVQGWSAGAVREHTRWLWSVDPEQLEGRQGWAVTLTVRDCPPTHAAWTELLALLLQALRDSPAVELVHWLVEWQERGVPHLHLAVYGPAGWEAPIRCTAGHVVVRQWLRLAAGYRPGWRGQDVKPIDGASGWFKYLSKHASRGVRHYQRQGKPAGWEKTGRMWGKSRSWPTVPADRALITTEQMWRYRRLVRGYLVADARATALRYQREGKAKKAAAAWHRVAFLRRMFKNPDRGESACRGGSGWAPLSVQLAMLALVGWDGTLKEG